MVGPEEAKGKELSEKTMSSLNLCSGAQTAPPRGGGQPSPRLCLLPGAGAPLPSAEGTSPEKAGLCHTHSSWGNVPWPGQRDLGQTLTASAECRPMELSEALRGRREFISTHRCLSEY